MDWFKTKKPLSSESVTPPSEQLRSLVRTMEDDMAGHEIVTEVEQSAEPLVTFRPDATAGAPFFAAPEITVATESEPASAEPSPFLSESNSASAEAAIEAPTFDPPLPTASPMNPGTPLRADVERIAFTTEYQSAAPAPKASALRFFNRLSQFFQNRKTRMVTLVAVLLLVTCGAGGYFWWQSAKDSDDSSAVKVESPKMPEVSIRMESQSQTKYQATQPNILSFDTETVTAEQIKNTLLQVSQSIQKDNLPGAIEFLVRDQKLNPLAFSRFAYLAKLNIPAELLGTLDEPFSLYIFIDDGRPRVALLMYAKDVSTFEAELKKSEKNLALALEPLFLDITTASKNNPAFRDGMYLGRPVRFANIDDTLGLSIDYAVRGRQWIIGTSKDSLRSVLDKTGL